jgi:hypothetical protein
MLTQYLTQLATVRRGGCGGRGGHGHGEGAGAPRGRRGEQAGGRLSGGGGAACRRGEGRALAAAADGAAAGSRLGGGQRRERRERERRERRKKNGRIVYFLTLPSARDLALGKDFFKILKYSLSSAHSAALGKYTLQFFVECQPAGTRQRLLCRVSFLDTRQSTFLFFLIFPTKIFVVCSYTI